ncbi:hypothetical protein [Nostoc sp. FACHB-888]|uniref:hypothetical protein n=1 Tax=Nostoc sp. FACHB-888 TaxID=2692842 RepID=UPI001682B7A4|nr:hypothetical protein [Nostoc sp. FACHB-888]MBD2248265.1 hypothetical protein [Nostoc sp. FACHB-888]
MTRNAQEAINIILRNERSAAHESAQSPKAQQASKHRVENSEYFKRFQYVGFINCNKPARRIIF